MGVLRGQAVRGGPHANPLTHSLPNPPTHSLTYSLLAFRTASAHLQFKQAHLGGEYLFGPEGLYNMVDLAQVRHAS